MDVVKESLVKDGNLIVHIGKPNIQGTRFFILTPQTALHVKKLIEGYLSNVSSSHEQVVSNLKESLKSTSKI